MRAAFIVLAAGVTVATAMALERCWPPPPGQDENLIDMPPPMDADVGSTGDAADVGPPDRCQKRIEGALAAKGKACLDQLAELGPDCPVSDTLRDQCEPVCGDGYRHGHEACDDGNGIENRPGDACDNQCRSTDPCAPFVKRALEIDGKACVEAMETLPESCEADPSQCTATCGDGYRQGDEQCDDGNRIDDDGCNRQCRRTFPCRSRIRNAVRVGGKACLDQLKAIEARCPRAAEATCRPVCGDGHQQGDEQCDDGNELENRPGDFCNNRCQVTLGE